MKIVYCFLVLVVGLVILFACNKTPRSKQNFIPMYVHPYFESQPLQIAGCMYQNELMSDNTSDMLSLAETIRKNIDNTDLISVAILSIRLYDLGLKDEASYWFYTTQFRANVMTDISPDYKREYSETMNSFHSLSGTYINGYSFGNIDKLIQTLKQVIEDNQSMKIPSGIYTELNFKPEEELHSAIQNQIDGISSFIEQLDENRELIKQQRKENGVEGKY